jgi:hypothetical protein
VRSLVVPVAVSFVASVLQVADARAEQSSAAISQETHRSHRAGRRIVSFWWLPVEYWVAAARELRKPENELERIDTLLEGYVILGMVDADVSADGTLRFATLEDANDRLVLLRNGRETKPVSRLDPKVGATLPELSYFMTASLGPMAQGLRLVLLPNIDDDGRPVVSGSGTGEIAARYLADGAEPVSLRWRAPLTSVVGPRRCPKGGEELEASWGYCPWHGVPVD